MTPYDVKQTCDGFHDDGQPCYGCFEEGQEYERGRIVAYIESFAEQPWRPASATTVQNCARAFADAIKRGSAP